MAEFNVGPGVATAIADHGDEARSDEMYIVNTEGVKVSQTVARDHLYYWIQEDNAVRAVPFLR